MNDTYVFYRSFHEALAELDIKEYGKIMYAINEYALNNNDEKVGALTGILKSLWTLIKPQIDANLRRREYGKMGGRPAEKKPKVLENSAEKKLIVIVMRLTLLLILPLILPLSRKLESMLKIII